MAAASVAHSTESHLAPSLVLGVGLSGFIDGIVLHQVHHMLTGDAGGEPMDTVAGLEANTLVDEDAEHDEAGSQRPQPGEDRQASDRRPASCRSGESGDVSADTRFRRTRNPG